MLNNQRTLTCDFLFFWKTHLISRNRPNLKTNLFQHCHQKQEMHGFMLVYVQSSRLSADAAGASKMESVRTDLVCGRFCIYIAVIGIFLLLGRDFECTCKPQVFDCNLYLVLPVFIILLFILWTDWSFQTVCKFLNSGTSQLHTFGFWVSFFRHIVKAAFIGLLWVVVVLVDGSWYVCCQNDLSEQQAQIPANPQGGSVKRSKLSLLN